MKDVEMREKLEVLRDFIWMRDIPHPTIPEYREWHENIQAILKKVDALIEEVANENRL